MKLRLSGQRESRWRDMSMCNFGGGHLNFCILILSLSCYPQHPRFIVLKTNKNKPSCLTFSYFTPLKGFSTHFQNLHLKKLMRRHFTPLFCAALISLSVYYAQTVSTFMLIPAHHLMDHWLAEQSLSATALWSCIVFWVFEESSVHSKTSH